jgi:hypothetical protein
MLQVRLLSHIHTNQSLWASADLDMPSNKKSLNATTLPAHLGHSDAQNKPLAGALLQQAKEKQTEDQ